MLSYLGSIRVWVVLVLWFVDVFAVGLFVYWFLFLLVLVCLLTVCLWFRLVDFCG